MKLVTFESGSPEVYEVSEDSPEYDALMSLQEEFETLNISDGEEYTDTLLDILDTLRSEAVNESDQYLFIWG